MTDKPNANPILEQLMIVRKLNDKQAAELLSVPVHTLRKWRTGERKPTASAVKLITLMLLLSAVAPSIVDSMSSN